MHDLTADRPLRQRTTRRIDVDRAVEATGPLGAPALVFLHGTRRTRTMWRHQLDGLGDEFRLVAVDLPAHGALADVPFRLADATAFVAEVIDAAAGGRAIVVGQSLGGYVGMDLAAASPERVAGLVLANATAEPRSIVRRAPRAVGTYLLVATGERVLPPRRARVETGDVPATAAADCARSGARRAVCAGDEWLAVQGRHARHGRRIARGVRAPAGGVSRADPLRQRRGRSPLPKWRAGVPGGGGRRPARGHPRLRAPCQRGPAASSSMPPSAGSRPRWPGRAGDLPPRRRPGDGRTMRCGIVLTVGGPRTVAGLASIAEAEGWDGVFTWDGIAIGPGDTYDPWV